MLLQCEDDEKSYIVVQIHHTIVNATSIILCGIQLEGYSQ